MYSNYYNYYNECILYHVANINIYITFKYTNSKDVKLNYELNCYTQLIKCFVS